MITNSIINIIANILMFLGGFMLHYHYVTSKLGKYLYPTMKVVTAFLLTGSLSRIIFDMNIIYTGINENFDVLEAAIATTRNIGLGGALLFMTFYFKNKL